MMAAKPPMSQSTDYASDGYDGGISDGDGGGGSSPRGGPGVIHNNRRALQGGPMDGDRYEDHNNSSGGEPHYMTGAFRGKECSYYVNGDKHYPPKKIVVNPKHFRDMSHYLDHLTDKISPAFGAVRKIHTPHHGTRIYNVNELKPGDAYVAAGNEKFRRIGYDQIISHERKKSPPYKYDADPVVHSRVFQCSGKIRKIENSSIIIKVWPNGGEKRTRRPRVVLLRRTAGWNISTVVVMVNDMLKDDCNGPVEALYNRNGMKLVDVDSLEHNGVYVALTKRDRFKRASYPDFATKDLHTSPRPDRKMLDPLYSRSNNSTSHSSPEHSNASSSQGVAVNGQSRRRPPPKREEDQVFPAKPVKHNRSFDRAKKVDLDKDEGGVFKAKNSNSHTKGAREVNDTRHTKTDLPIDQQRAKEVDEDISKDDPYNQYSRQQHPRGQPQPRGGQQPPQAQNGGGGYHNTEAKANSRRQQPATSQPRNGVAAKKEQQQHKKDLKTERERSAVKIQSNFRGYKTRKDLAANKNKNKNNNTNNSRQKSPTPPPHAAAAASPPRSSRSREDTFGRSLITPVRNHQRQSSSPQYSHRTKSPSPPPAYDFKEEEKAATQIQAGYRGFVARKQIQAERAAKAEVNRANSEIEDYQSIARGEANKLIDNANNKLYEEEEKAATKIQAGFRGFKSRQEFQAKKAQQEIQSQNKEEELAATKIQANYRGHKTRSSLKEMNNNKVDDEVKPAARASPKPATSRPVVDDSDDDDDDDYDKAAIKIQAGFRGYQTRKELGRV